MCSISLKFSPNQFESQNTIVNLHLNEVKSTNPYLFVTYQGNQGIKTSRIPCVMASKTLVAAASLAARGSGGRSSVSGITATVFGGTGFLGRYVTSHLGRIGSQVTVPYRGDELLARHLKVMGDLGQITPVPFEMRDEDSVRQSLQGSSVVINLMGKHIETLNYKYNDVHVESARRLAEISKEEGVTNFIHVSTLKPRLPCKSKWLHSKLQGEEVIRDIYPNSTIIRPSDMFGSEDRFLVRMAQNLALTGIAFVPNFGERRIQPVWVNDVASVIAAAARDPERFSGKLLELAGPDVLSMKQLYEHIAKETKRNITFIPAPTKVIELGAKLSNIRLPFLMPNPTYSGDQVMIENSEPILDPSKSGVLRFEHLDAVAVSIYSDVTKEIVRRFRRGGDRSSLFYVD